MQKPVPVFLNYPKIYKILEIETGDFIIDMMFTICEIYQNQNFSIFDMSSTYERDWMYLNTG